MRTTSAHSEQPGFSVVTPSFNQQAYLRANIEAVIAQQHPGVEHIIIDNASSDGTVTILEEYPSLTWVSEPDRGQSDAVNKGVALSNNDWIVWVNSDDFLCPGALAKITEHIHTHPDASVIISNIIQTDASGQITSRIEPKYTRWKLQHWWWCATPFLWQPGTIVHRRVFEQIGLLNVNLHYGMDFDFFLRAQDHFSFSYLNADLVAFRRHADQKGHASEIPFIEERIASTLAYWRSKSGLTHGFYRVLCYFITGSLVFVEGLRQHERGNQAQGLRLVKQGLLRNPFGIFRPEHLGYWIRRLIGPERYYKLRSHTK